MHNMTPVSTNSTSHKWTITKSHATQQHSTGRGIFATNPIPAHTIIDTSPVLVFDPSENASHIQQTVLSCYTLYV